MTDKIPILFIHPWTHFYGAEASLFLLVQNLNKDIFRPLVVLPDEGPLWSKLEALEVTLSKSPLEPWFTTDDSAEGALRWLADLPKRVQRIVDIVHDWDIKIIYSNVADILEGAIAARLTSLPHICSVRNNRLTHSWLKSFIPPERVYQVLGALSHMIVPVSSSVRDALMPLVAQTKLRVIYNGVDTQSFDEPLLHDSRGAEYSLATTTRKPRVSSFGRVDVQKGYDLLIDAAVLVVKAQPEVRFSVFGAFQNKSLYRRLIEQLDRHGLPEVFRFEGHSERVQEEMSKMDLLVVSSKEEGLALVVLEAMLAGKPVVSTLCGGSEEVILDGETGYLVPLGDPGALADAILKVLKDTDRARQMGLKGRERVLQHFDNRSIMNQYETLYLEALEGPGAIPAEDTTGEVVLIEALLKTLGKYSGDFYEMGLRSRQLYRLESKLKNTWAYNAIRNLAERLREGVSG